MSRSWPLFLLVLALAAVHAVAGLPRTRGYRSRREAAAAASQLADLSSAQKAKLFEDFKQLHGKKYASAAEDRARFAAFQSNLADLVRWNLRPKASFYKGLHRHSDLTFQQFSAARLMPGQPAADLAARAAAGPRFDAARHRRKLAQAAGAVLDLWDWRAQGKVPAVRDQGGCGSCWAFAGLGALEIKALIDGTSAVPDASEQHMVDCCNAAASSASGVPFASTGCDGGFCDDVFTFASQWFAAPEASYPYTATTGTGCPSWATAAPASAPAGSLALTPQPGFQWVAASPYDIMAAVASTGPVTAYFRVEDSFYGYAGGVYPASACTPGELNHAMLVVGYNRTAGVGHPESYFLLRNSWGPWWGAEGYVRVQMTADNVGTCQMYSAGLMLPLGTQAVGSAPPPPLPSPSPSPSPVPSSSPSPSPSPFPSPKPCKTKRCE